MPMENNAENRLKLADAVWESLSLDDLYQQFIHQCTSRYKTDPDQFDEAYQAMIEEDCALMGLDNEGDE